MSGTLADLIGRYGYAVVVLLVGAEGVGIPLPGETALLAAGALAAQGHLSIAGVILAAAIGVAVGGCGGYWVGRTAGHAVVARYGAWVGITADRLQRTHQFFVRYGTRAVVIGRFLPIVRILSGVVAGITEMPFRQFATYNTIAGIVWATVFGMLGYVFGRNLPALEQRLGRAGIVAAGLVVIAGLAYGVWRRHQEKPARG